MLITCIYLINIWSIIPSLATTKSYFQYLPINYPHMLVNDKKLSVILKNKSQYRDKVANNNTNK